MAPFPSRVASAVLLAAALGPAGAHAEDAAPGAADPAQAFLALHCVRCHSGERPRGEFDATALAGLQPADRALRLALVAEKLELGEMPPLGEPAPEPGEVSSLLAWIADLRGPTASRALDPGPAVLRRLSRLEWRNTVLDLFGIDVEVEALLPPDDVAHGFDVVGEALALSPVHLERYLLAAEYVAERAIVVLDPKRPRAVRVAAHDLAGDAKGKRDDLRTMSTNGSLGFGIDVAQRGEYVVRAEVAADQAGPQLAAAELRVDGRPLSRSDVRSEYPERELVEALVRLEPGRHKIEVAFVNDYWNPKAARKEDRDRNLSVAWLELAGPTDVDTPSAFQRRLHEQAPGEDPRVAIERVAELAWRRPATSAETRRLLALSDGADPWNLRVQRALVGALTSPSFLLHGAESGPGVVAESGLQDPFRIASNLSYFLWRSAPDAELRELARSGALARRDVLHAQVERLLRDPRAGALSEVFAVQWLQLVRLAEATPDPTEFGAFDDELREAMRAESLLVFDAVLRERRPIAELLDSDWTYANERLAAFYGLPSVHGASMRRVRIPDALRSQRGGLLTHAGVLTVTSNPTRTSAVKRGKWILEALLDAAPPPPPPGVDSLPAGVATPGDASLRERLELHRKNPECASCHTTMDALGLALENYDAIGRRREREGGFAIDASAELPDGRRFEGPAELRAILASDDAFARSLAANLAVYALGRGLERDDELALARGGCSNRSTLADLVHLVVDLPAFTQRRESAAPRSDEP